MFIPPLCAAGYPGNPSTPRPDLLWVSLSLTTSTTMATLLLISTPGGKLTYEDHDIVDCMETGLSPGRAVEANAGGHWSFIYITDKNCMETMMLRTPRTSGEGEDEQQVAKRRFCCVIPAAAADTCKTFRSLEDAPEDQKYTWAEFEASLCVNKDGDA